MGEGVQAWGVRGRRLKEAEGVAHIVDRGGGHVGRVVDETSIGQQYGKILLLSERSHCHHTRHHADFSCLLVR